MDEKERNRIAISVQRLIDSGANEDQIRTYLSDVEGLALKQKRPLWQKAGRIGAEGIGGIVGGAAMGTASGPLAPLGAAAGAGVGAAGAGAWWDLAMQAAGIDPVPTPEEAAARVAGDFAINAGVPLGLTAIGKGLVPLARGAFSRTAERAGNLVRKPFASESSRRMLEEVESIGVERPIAGVITGSKGAQKLEAGLMQSLTGSEVLSRVSKENIDKLSRAISALGRKYGPPGTKETVGGVLKKAAPEAVTQYRALSKKLFNGIESVIGEKTLVPADNTLKELAAIANELKDTPELSDLLDATIKRVRKAVISDSTQTKEVSEGFIRKLPLSDVTPGRLPTSSDAFAGRLPYDALKRLHSFFGDLLETPGVTTIGGVKAGQAKRLFGAVSDDMMAAASAKGLGKEMGRANEVYRAIKTQDLPWLEQIQRAKYDEQAFNALMQGAKDGGSRLRIMRRNMKPEEWDVVAGSVLSKLGMAKPAAQEAAGETFSASTFLTNWSSLSDDAKKVIFGGSRYKHLAPELDKLIRVASSLKSAEKMANITNTAGAQFALQMVLAPVLGFAGGGVGGGMVTAAGMSAAPWAAARLVTNPKFVRWLTGASQIARENPKAVVAMTGGGGAMRDFWGPMSYAAAQSSKKWGTHMARLFAMAKYDESVAEYARTLLSLEGKEPQQ